MKKLLVLIWLAGFSLSSLSAEVWHESTIKKVYPASDGSVVFIFNSDSSACTNGNNPKYYYLVVGENGVTESGFERIYSAALTAAVSQKVVNVNFDDSTASCFINRLIVSF